MGLGVAPSTLCNMFYHIVLGNYWHSDLSQVECLSALAFRILLCKMMCYLHPNSTGQSDQSASGDVSSVLGFPAAP